ncbi:hypothetical protein C4S76_07395 [Apibacter adventoris]|nr:hypothetical protein C4S76_07395 [Apibacter adventoris]
MQQKMKVILSSAFIIFTYVQSFAYSILQINNNISIGDDGPPFPITPFAGDPSEPVEPPKKIPGSPIDIIIPFLLISVIILTVYFIRRKNKLKNI